MVVDKIGNTGKVVPPSGVKPGKMTPNTQAVGNDSVSISTEAQKAQKAEKVIENAVNLVKKTPGIRKERVDAVKERFSQGYYDRDTEILEKVAEKIAQALLR